MFELLEGLPYRNFASRCCCIIASIYRDTCRIALPVSQYVSYWLTALIDAQSFFDCLITSICEYQNKGKMFICGDFNMLDFIEGVDVVTVNMGICSKTSKL